MLIYYENIKKLWLPPLTQDQIERLRALAEEDDSTIDYSDSPKSTPEQLASATSYYADSLRLPKTDIHIKIDYDNLE